MTLKELKEAGLVSRSDEYIPGKGKECAKVLSEFTWSAHFHYRPILCQALF